jgi:hypothetical protein
VLAVCSCATTKQNQYAYEEMDSCPSQMTEQQHYSGVVRCRALCSSYARDFVQFGDDCKCFCAPPGGLQRHRPQPASPNPYPWSDGQTSVEPDGAELMSVMFVSR